MTTIEECLRPLLEQIEGAVQAGFWFPALISAFAIPDMLAALGDPDGRTSGSKYRAWLEANMGMSTVDAKQLYGFRCSLLHEGSARVHGKHPRIAFTPPGGGQMHNFTFEAMGGGAPSEVSMMSVPMFVNDLTNAVLAHLVDDVLAAGLDKPRRDVHLACGCTSHRQLRTHCGGHPCAFAETGKGVQLGVGLIAGQHDDVVHRFTTSLMTTTVVAIVVRRVRVAVSRCGTSRPRFDCTLRGLARAIHR